jgi:hypothetical protein
MVDECGTVNSVPCFFNKSTCASKEDVYRCEDLGSSTACVIAKGEFSHMQTVGSGCVWGRRTSESMEAVCMDSTEVSNCSQLVESDPCESTELVSGGKCEWLSGTNECVEVQGTESEDGEKSRGESNDFLWLIILIIALVVVLVCTIVIIVACTLMRNRKKKKKAEEEDEVAEGEKSKGRKAKAKQPEVSVNAAEEPRVEGEEEGGEDVSSDSEVDANEVDEAAAKGIDEYIDALHVDEEL